MLGLWYRSPNSGRVPRDPKNSFFRTNKQKILAADVFKKCMAVLKTWKPAK